MRKIGRALYYFFGIDSLKKIEITSLDVMVASIFVGFAVLLVSSVMGIAGLLYLITGKPFAQCSKLAMGLLVLAYFVGYFATWFKDRITGSWKRAKSEENKEKDGRV